jgi:hypothetical protein
MDATRPRRTRDRARQQWYAGQRQRRFAQFMGVAAPARVPTVPRVNAPQHAAAGSTATG